MKKLLIATHNPAKTIEIKSALNELKKQGVELLTLNDVGVEKEPEETGKTFQENSALKAKFYSKLTNLATIADDGGLIIPFLGNAPGVRSRRWPGYEAGDQELIDYTLSHLKNAGGDERTAFLETCVTFFYPPTGQIFFEQEKIKGHIAEIPSPRPTNGYPYRALFVVDEFGKYYDELTREEHDKINHRYKALRKLTKRIENLIS
ncbi:non-canonical purine NTP pyrophosphatase [Patescibacteria group bacterium]|nr:non-canonical purine NTP pyrophosphatase [Patescibacteria group bacterium]